MYTDDVVDNYSTIPANDNITYTMPINSYSLSAKNTQTSATVADTVVSITADTQIVWNID